MMSNEILGSRLATWHNLYYFVDLMRAIRQAIRENRLEALKRRALEPYSQPAEH